MPATRPGALSAIWHEVCPRCRQGPIYRTPLWRGFLNMHERCPNCGMQFEREQGYFVGAMYFSYLLSIPPCLLIALALWRITGWGFDTVMLATFVTYLPFVPAVTRFARVLWMYVDRHFDP